MKPLRLVKDYDLPDAEVMAIAQNQAGTDILHEDKSTYARFKRLRGVHALAGAMAPGEVWMLGAQVGAGKTLFCQNLFDDLIEQGVPTLYIGTEQDPEKLRIKHACLRAGVSPKLMLKPELEDIGTTAYEMAVDAVEEQKTWLRKPPQCYLALYATSEYVNRNELDLWINGGVRKYDIHAVIVDHIDQVEHGAGVNPVQEVTATVQFLHHMARRHQMPIIVANQVRRHPDPMKRYTPPEVDDFAGTSAKERVADVMFGIWRPMRDDLDIKELREMQHRAKMGSVSEDRVYMPNTMGVRLLKDRLGTAPGKQTMLHVGRGGMLSDDPSLTHGIKASGTL